MKIVDMLNPKRVDRIPDKLIVLLSAGKWLEQEFVVKRIELRQYIEGKNEKLGPYCLITTYVETDRGSVEKIFEQGHLGIHAIDEIAAYVTSHLVIPTIVLQAVKQLREYQERKFSDVIARRTQTLIGIMQKNGFLTDKRIKDTITKIPRHLFVPSKSIEEAYEDKPLPTKKWQTISQPSVVARMIEWLDVKEGNKVLEVGTGSGWQSAILASLVGEGKVYSVERIPELVQFAKKNLLKVGVKNVEIFEGDGTLGLQEKAPFDRIIISAACPNVPSPLLDQLAINGLLVAPVGEFLQSMVLLKKTIEGIREQKRQGGYVFAPLVGQFGFKNHPLIIKSLK